MVEENVVMFPLLLGFENVGRESSYIEKHLGKLQEKYEQFFPSCNTYV